MYRLSPPKFKFSLYLIENNKYKPNMTQSGQTICYADTYEISSDGAITFFQIGISLADNKKVKIPVLSYPKGKWETCVLLDDNNQFPVFSPNSQGVVISSNYNSSKGGNPTTPSNPPLQTASSNLSSNNELKNSDNEQHNLDELNNMFNQNQNNSNSLDFEYSHSNNWQANRGTNPINMNNFVPGVNQHNPEEYKKKKNEFLEKRIKDYIKYEDTFNIDKFLPSIQQEAKAKDIGKISDIDVTWAASNLIRSKAVLARKFSDSESQKILGMILPDIMRRQWSGKMGPILQVLQDKEETKNVTAIDLAVWMVHNGFTD